jgi:hypothetical protein
MRSLLAFACSILLTTCIASVATAQTSAVPHKNWEDPVKLDNRGYIRQWLVLGPVNYGDKYAGEDIDVEQINEEGKLAPKAGDKVMVESYDGPPGAGKFAKKELTWKVAKTDSFELDLNSFFKLDSSDGMGAYAISYLDAADEIKGVQFSLSSNDNCKVYLNGKKVHLYVGGRQLEEDSDVVKDLTLAKGINVVVFKIWNDSNNWSGCLRLLDKDGKPLANVTTRLPAQR